MRDSGIRDIALRASGLSGSSLALVSALVEQARRNEGLPDVLHNDSGPATQERRNESS